MFSQAKAKECYTFCQMKKNDFNLDVENLRVWKSCLIKDFEIYYGELIKKGISLKIKGKFYFL